jgi:CheY-like chemotaxis protein
MNGYEILEAKRDDPSIKDIPVMIVSNSGQPVELQRALELGATDYFIKAQFDPDEIISKVTALVPLTKITSSVSLADKKILLVEDDKFLSDVLTKKLTNEGCKVLHAVTGESSLEVAEREQPDMILLDLVLPGITGFDVLEKLRANPKTKGVHVIVLSNLSQQEDMDRANALGIDAFLVKAMNTPGNIFNTIVSILSSS